MKKNINNEEKNRLTVHVGYAARAAGTAEAAEELLPQACGDTVTSCRLPDGSRAVILSDGMGHGNPAASGSRTAAETLRRLLKQGMPTAGAIREVNRCLLERSSKCEEKEFFATMDLVIIDQNSGRAKFYKMGAAPSYLIRGRCIRKIQQPALPVGILPGIRLTHVSTRLLPGDVIVMVSDGICDSGWRQHTAAGGDSLEADWMKSFLNDMITAGRSAEKTVLPGPRMMAASLLEAARQRYGNEEADDATAAIITIRESRRKNDDEE